MSKVIPRSHVSFVSAWLAAEGHTLMTAPPSLVALALSYASKGGAGQGFGGWPVAGRLGFDRTNQAP